MELSTTRAIPSCLGSIVSQHFMEPEGSKPNSQDLSLSWARPIQSTLLRPTSTKSILILSNHLRLDLPSGFLPLAFPPTTYTRSSSPPFVLHSLHKIIEMGFHQENSFLALWRFTKPTAVFLQVLAPEPKPLNSLSTNPWASSKLWGHILPVVCLWT
jgi:hypothetical protein